MTLESSTETIRSNVGEDSGLGATVKFDFGDDGMVFLDGKSVPNSVSNDDGGDAMFGQGIGCRSTDVALLNSAG